MTNNEVLHIWSSDDGKWYQIDITDEELDMLCQEDIIESMRNEYVSEQYDRHPSVCEDCV